MVAGDTHFTAISTLLSLPQIQAGALRAIATGNLTRETQFPELPTVAEQGFPGFEAIQWIGLLTTAGTPKEIIERINAEVNRALRDPDLIAKFAQQGIVAGGRHAGRIRPHDRDRNQELDRDRARGQHQGGVRRESPAARAGQIPGTRHERLGVASRRRPPILMTAANRPECSTLLGGKA